MCSRFIYAVDLKPAQNYLLNFQLAAFTAVPPHADLWALFGAGRRTDFPARLLSGVAPHLSSRAT